MSTPKSTPLHPAPLYLEEGAELAPVTVLHEFFLEHNLIKTRALLWQWFRCTITGSLANAGSGDEKKELIDFYEHMQQLVEAAHIISVYDRQYHVNRLNIKK